ncbi:MAG: class I SAM-dependent methyltransferase [Bdellovibrionales bacterium]|nr:class I SAM-dependent methyltransferase [Bdellovibrionales bacterium]
MTTKAVTEFFDKSPSGAYDERNRKLAPISDNLHFLTGLALKGLPADARILCVGVGTGAEILGLAHAYPGWTFDGVEPSAAMLDDCRKRLDQAQLLSRCQLFKGYLSEFVSTQKYDAVLCVLVMHFVRDISERAKMFQDMAGRLNPGGMLVNAEISYDLSAEKFPDILEKWKQVQILMGATQESLDQLPKMLRDQLLILPPAKTEELIRAAGFSEAIQFFQSFLIHAWYARK